MRQDGQHATPRTMTATDLVPSRDLQHVEANTWRATGCDPQFVIPHEVPAGWLHIRVRLRCEGRARMEWYTITEDHSATPVERSDHFGAAEQDFYLHLVKPVRGLRFDPLDVEGAFVLEQLCIQRPPSVLVVLRALARKLRLLWRYQRLGPCLGNGLRLLATGQIRRSYGKVLNALSRPQFQAGADYDPDSTYAHWQEARASEPAVLGPAKGTRLALLLDTIASSQDHLSRTFESIRRQKYTNWELHLVAPSTTANKVTSNDPRIHLGSRRSFSESTGEYVAWIDPGDMLHANALAQVAMALDADPRLDMIYTDEDCVLSDGRRVNPVFKPAWSPELLQYVPYTGRLCFYRTAILKDAVALRMGQDHDAALRMLRSGARVGHLPDILYHRGMKTTNTAPRCISKPIPLTGSPHVSILVPTAYRTTLTSGRETFHVDRCVRSIFEQTSYANYDVILIDNGRPPDAVRETLMEWPLTRLAYAQPFNWARAMNQAAAHATGAYLVTLDDDTEVLSPEWLEHLLEYGQRPGVGAVGARLLYPDGRLQHAGVAVLQRHAVHPYAGFPGNHAGYLGHAQLPRNCSAVTSACMLTPVAVFKEVGGFNESFAFYCNDIDYCLRLTQRGWRIVYTPHATLRHHEAATKTALRPEETETFQKLWADRLADDPYYNANLSTQHRDYRIETDPERIRQTSRHVRYGY